MYKHFILKIFLINFFFRFIAEDVITTSNETDTRKLRSRRPNPKYLNEQFETE